MSTTILLADKLQDGAFEGLPNIEVLNKPELTAGDLPSVMSEVQVLVVRSTKVTAAAIEAAPGLKLIVRAGSGVNNIDVKAASARGIFVANCPGRNAVAVAELAMGLILCLDRRIADNVADLRAGRWNKGGYAKAQGLKGQKLGLVGFGNIAQQVARRAKAFDIEVSSCALSLTPQQAEEHGVEYVTDLKALFETCDIISLHIPAAADTKGMIGKDLLNAMKPGAMLINTSRAQVIDNDALTEALTSERIRFGTDVFAMEPEGKAGAFEDPLGKLPNVYGTHHIGASTQQAQNEVAQCAIEIVQTYLASGEVPLAVNHAELASS